MTRDPATAPDAAPPAVALLPWGDLFEDWLDTLGVGLDELRESFTGSWLFGWAGALRTADVRTVVVAVTSRVPEPLRFEHRPTGAAVHLLPPTALHRRVAPRMAREGLQGRRDPRSLAAAALAQVAPYLATPPHALRAALRAERCTALVCQEYETPRFDVCVALRRRLGVPVFATFQGGDYQGTRLERLARPWAMRRADGFVVAPRAEASRIGERYGVAAARVARVFNPVDTSFWHAGDRRRARAELGIPEEALVVAWHGQLHPRKGVDLLLEAWRVVRSARPERDLRLVLIGSGEEGVARAVRAAGPAEAVELVEQWVDRERIRGVLSAADVYAFPSRHEGFPVAPLEAMACGLPVVAAAAQGVADIFEHGEDDGGVVVPRDDAQALAGALGRLLDEEPARRELGRLARRRIESAFAQEAVGRALRAIFENPTTIRQ